MLGYCFFFHNSPEGFCKQQSLNRMVHLYIIHMSSEILLDRKLPNWCFMRTRPLDNKIHWYNSGFFVSGHIKNVVYNRKPQTLKDLKNFHWKKGSFNNSWNMSKYYSKFSWKVANLHWQWCLISWEILILIINFSWYKYFLYIFFCYSILGFKFGSYFIYTCVFFLVRQQILKYICNFITIVPKYSFETASFYRQTFQFYIILVAYFARVV